MHPLRDRRGSIAGSTPALLAALALVLQTFLASWALAAAPAAPQLDMFGNPLCVTGGDETTGGHPDLAGCCAAGCACAASSPAPPPAAVAMLLRPSPGLAPRLRPAEAAQRRAPDERPGNPRAPPFAV